MRQIAQHLAQRRPEIRRGPEPPGLTAWLRAAPVANSSSVSEVEVSLSTVIALNEASVASPQERLQHLGRQRRVGDDEGQHGRHVGRDHARAFGDPGEGHGHAQ